MRSLFSEKMLISNRCITSSMSNLIKKSWTDSIMHSVVKIFHFFLTSSFSFFILGKNTDLIIVEENILNFLVIDLLVLKI